MRFYIAAGMDNIPLAIRLTNVLLANGHEQTYDWTAYGDVRYAGPQRMGDVAFIEYRALKDAELVIDLLPAGGTAHTELGMAIATRSNKRIILWSPDGEEFNYDDRTCVFYYHPSVERIVCPPEVLLEIFDTRSPDFDYKEFKR